MFSQSLILFLCVLSPSDNDAVKMYNKEYHPNTILKAKGGMIFGKKANYWYQYHTNGQLAFKGYYQGNNKSAYWYYYDKNGSLEREGHYNNRIAKN